MDTGNAAAERVGNVEDAAIGIGERRGFGEPRFVERCPAARRLDAREQLDGRASPTRPLAEESAIDPAHGTFTADGDAERREQIDNDVVVVAGIERDIVAPLVGHGTNDVDRLIAIEGRDLDGPDIRQLGEPPPERIAQHPSANCGLQIEAEDGHDFGELAAMGQELALGLALPFAEAE